MHLCFALKCVAPHLKDLCGWLIEPPAAVHMLEPFPAHLDVVDLFPIVVLQRRRALLVARPLQPLPTFRFDKKCPFLNAAIGNTTCKAN